MRRGILLLIFFINISRYLNAQAEQLAIDSLDIEEIIIQTTRSSSNDPVTFQNISSRVIEKIYSGQDPAVLLQQLTPSIISYSDAGTDIGNYAQFRLRGISQSRINVTLNGIPLNDMIDQGVYFSNFSDLGNSIESIQVQRGVGASNAGVASFGGAINFESANIFGPSSMTDLQMTTGSFGTLRTSAEVNTGLMKNQMGAYFRMSKTSVEGYKDHSASNSYSFFGSIGLLDDKDVLKLTGFIGKTQNDQSYLPVLLEDIVIDPKINYNHPNDTDDFEQELIQLQYSSSLSSNTRFDASIYYGGARGIFPFGIDDHTQFVFGLSNNHYGLLSHLTFEYGTIKMKGGVQAYNFDRTNYEYISPDISNPYDRDHTSKNEISIFNKLSFDIDDFSIYGDFELRAVDLTFKKDPELGTGMALQKDWLFLNYVTGINYNIGSDQSLYFSFGRTAREPTRSDIRNGVLQEEYVNDLELGWRKSAANWNIGANLFHMSFENEISQVGALRERSYMEIRQNVPKSRRTGLELEFKYIPSGKVSISFNGAYMNTNVREFDNGTEVLYDVSHIFSPDLVLRPQIDVELSERVGVVLSGRHVSASFMELANISSFILPSHTVVNTQFDIDIGKRSSISLMINNIFDEQYFTDGAPVDLDFDGIVEGPGFRVQPPRHFYIMFTVRL